MNSIRITELREAINPEVINDRLLGEVSVIGIHDGLEYDLQFDKFDTQGSELSLYTNLENTVKEIVDDAISERDADRDDAIYNIKRLVNRWRKKDRTIDEVMREIAEISDKFE